MSEQELSQQHQQHSQALREYHQESEARGEQERINYYHEFCRLYLANHVMTTQLKELNLEKNQLIAKYNKLEKKAEEMSEGNSGQIDQKKRRIRRSAVDIARHYKCQVEHCTKSYGSEGSLNQHIKLKHPQLFKGETGYDQNYIVKEYENEQQESI